MAKERRVLRLQQLILETVAQVIQGELDDPRIGMITVTKVRLSADLSSALIFWSSLAGDAERRTQERGLSDALPLIQRQVASVLGTRVTPTLSVRYDGSMEKAQRIDEIFKKIAVERGETPSDPDDAADAADAAGDEAGDEGADDEGEDDQA